MSFVVTHGRRRRSSTVRRRHKKTTTTTTDRLITEFNEGKEIDLDRLTSARGIYTRACDDLARPSSSHRLEIDFNEGKDFDLDRLTSARGSASRTCDDMTGPQSSEFKVQSSQTSGTRPSSQRVEIDLDKITTARTICSDLARPPSSHRVEIDLDKLTSAHRSTAATAYNDMATGPASSQRIEIEFSQGKEIDLDKLATADGPPSSHRVKINLGKLSTARGFTGDDIVGPPSSETVGSRARSQRVEAHATVRNWLRTQNNIDGAASSRSPSDWTQPKTTTTIRHQQPRHSVDIHHL